MNQRQFVSRVIKPAAFVLSLIPFGLLLWDGFTGGLGGNPIEEITHRTGDWTLYFLLIALSVTPLRRLSGWNQLIKLRRMIGLIAFFYATLHFGTYIVLDLFFYLPEIVEDIAKRPYITVGFTALLILTALAATSNDRMVKRLGGRRWSRLHKSVYVAAGLGVIHFLWSVKADTLKPIVLGFILIVLLLSRFRFAVRRSARVADPAR